MPKKFLRPKINTYPLTLVAWELNVETITINVSPFPQTPVKSSAHFPQKHPCFEPQPAFLGSYPQQNVAVSSASPKYHACFLQAFFGPLGIAKMAKVANLAEQLAYFSNQRFRFT